MTPKNHGGSRIIADGFRALPPLWMAQQSGNAEL
jgi:hypothetical protein